MIRLVIPLLLISLLAWGLLYGLRGKVKTETKTAIRQGAVALTIATGVLLCLTLLFSLRGYIND